MVEHCSHRNALARRLVLTQTKRNMEMASSADIFALNYKPVVI